MGFIADDIRLPPDPKIGTKNKTLLPDLNPQELEQLKDIIRGILTMSVGNRGYARVLFGWSASSTTSTPAVEKKLNESKPLFKKILGDEYNDG